MKLLNSTIDPHKAFIHIISNCDGRFINDAFATIKKSTNMSAAETLLSSLNSFPYWDKGIHSSFLYLFHCDSNGSKIFEEIYETPDDFPNDFGKYFTCPKCGNTMIVIEKAEK